eukprot:CAMPEP_0195089784 /NCGR_PEP_ID=MMETSP0448-20130528/28980_1 /TAXON_ID=66468 /ORGANISM="Heterocapsa triquestra, Strain CCMP 448" /LENGTH=167 /DNA_ID=CAMNT_0040123549 /DNA_START=59 /DNA_END=559 /DNA_ORIENTATION=+
MDALANATEEEAAALPDYICTFHQWMLSIGRNANTSKGYMRQIPQLFQDDGKGPAAMATEEYFNLTKTSWKNKSGNGQRSATLRQWINFWKDWVEAGKPLEKAAGRKEYQVTKANSGRGKAAYQIPDTSEEGPEAKRLRTELVLPDDWKVVFHARSSGDLLLSVSPG